MQTSSWGCLIGIQFFGEGQTSNSNDSSNGKWFTLATCGWGQVVQSSFSVDNRRFNGASSSDEK
jgi:hypothetical protein